MEKRDLEKRTKAFAIQIINFVAEMPQDRVTYVLGNQLLRSGTSIGANYREACRAESTKDFIHKIAIVEKEAAETYYWLELCSESKSGNFAEISRLMDECDQLIAIFTATGRTAKSKLRHRTKSKV